MNKIPSKYYSLSQMAESLQSVIRKTYTGSYWIKAEIAKLNFYPKSGHCYPDLVEKQQGRVLAQMRAIIWSRDYFRINADFVKKTGKPLSDGMEILFLARPQFSPVHGLSLMISDISVEFAMGRMALEKQQNLERLKKEGLFDKNKKLPFPLLPQRIAIISVETSKGFHDFINIIDHNSRGYKFFWMLFPALLQGDEAVASISGQLQQIRKVKHHFDLVAIIRGGGGDVGLSCYDSYELAAEVASFELPVLSGIGHSTNETLVEMVAHFNPITPTDLAYFLQQKFDNLAVTSEEMQQRIVELGKYFLMEKSRVVDDLSRDMEVYSRRLLEGNKHLLSTLSRNLKYKVDNLLRSRQYELKYLSEKLPGSSRRILQLNTAEIQSYQGRARKFAHDYLQKEQTFIEHLSEKIELMKPENILKKGYSLTMIDGKPLKDASDIKVGAKLQTRLYKGEIESEVIKIMKDE